VSLDSSSSIGKLAVGVDEAMKLLSCPSRWAFHAECRDLGLVAYRRGKYRVRDIENALAKAARRAQERR
jgi:hypothetical protein